MFSMIGLSAVILIAGPVHVMPTAIFAVVNGAVILGGAS